MKARQSNDPAATLESESYGHQNSRHFRWGTDQLKPVKTTAGRMMKFAYASGSKPLDGYTIKRGIGVGGFGEVYFALSDAGKEVALKRIQRNLDIELRGVKQCLNLKHINLISLWDIRTNDSGESWVVMEYVPGPSLLDIVEAHPSGLPESDVKQWFCSTAAGVAYLHDQGIVHRDLKPGNIFFDEDQQVIKIGDYGLSKFISCSRRSGQTESVGTFHYMAPEIGKGVYGKEIDIYALGIILFEVLTGRVPFEGESSQEIIMKHLTADPDLSGVPQEFHQVIRNALLKDPELRYSNVPEMCADLPWPDIAENSQNIVTRNAVGPVMLNGYSDKPKLSRTATAEERIAVESSDDADHRSTRNHLWRTSRQFGFRKQETRRYQWSFTRWAQPPRQAAAPAPAATDDGFTPTRARLSDFAGDHLPGSQGGSGTSCQGDENRFGQRRQLVEQRQYFYSCQNRDPDRGNRGCGRKLGMAAAVDVGARIFVPRLLHFSKFAVFTCRTGR